MSFYAYLIDHVKASEKYASKFSELDLLERGCEFKSPLACHQLGTLYYGGNSSLEVNGKKAKDCFKKACNAGQASSCSALGVLYLRGDEITGTKQNMSKSFKYFQTACHRDHGKACQILAVMYRKGDGVPADNAKFLEYKARAEALLL